MKHIVAIGGGEIGRPGYLVETTHIDTQIIALTGKTKPNVLFLPTASKDSPTYFDVFKEHYGRRLGCHVSVLNLYSKPSKDTITKLIKGADIIYVGGGNTLSMMSLWRRMGADKLLVEAYEDGTILCGLSAGAICWFNTGLSDSRSFTSGGKVWDYINVRGLNLKPLMVCPHYDSKPKRRPALRNSLKGTSQIAIAIDNCAALEIKDDTFRILTCKPGAKVYKTYWHHNKYIVEEILPTDEYLSLEKLGC